MADIIYTKVDEAPELASGSFLPIIESFTKPAGITIGRKDISLVGRIIAHFPENLTDEQKQPDDLSNLGELVENLMPTLLSCQISVLQYRSCNSPLPNCRTTDTIFLITLKNLKTTLSKKSKIPMVLFPVAPLIQYFDKVT